MASSSAVLLSKNKFYECRRPLHRFFGAEVVGVDLKQQMFDDNSDEFFMQLKTDLVQYRILLFRNQENMSDGECQVALSQGLGRVHSTFYKHPRSPHPDIFRVSNDAMEGCTNVGRSGWHIDGTFLPCPFLYQTMYFPSVSQDGDTYFIPLKELYERQSIATQERWENLWMVTNDLITHPLVYKHPTRNDTTLCFHCGRPFVSKWMIMDDDDISNSQFIPGQLIQEEIEKEIHCATTNDDNTNLVLKMKWQKGDLAITDNLALAHYACPDTQQPREKASLRILHRTTVLDDTQTCLEKENGMTSFRIIHRHGF